MAKQTENRNNNNLFASRFPIRNPDAKRIFELRQAHLPEEEKASDKSNPYLVEKRLESRDDAERTNRTYGEK